MSKLKLWIGIALVFILGSLAGALGMGMYTQYRFERIVFDDSRPAHHPRRPMMRLLMKKLDRELNLTKAQRLEIEKIITEVSENVHSIMRQKHPELEELAKESIELIKEKLTPEQREKIENLKLFERMKKRMSRRNHHGPGFAGETPDKTFASLKEHLKLREEQEERVRLIIEQRIEKRNRIVEAHRETVRRDKHAMRNEIREIQDTAKKQLAKILSEEQMSTYSEIQEDQGLFHMEGPSGPHRFVGPPLE